MDVDRKGPWTVEEDSLLMDYVNTHGEGRWNSLARHAGLKRSGKSCRLRWLNYLRPNVRRGNITLEEQLLILQLHSRWGNRWSKIAEYLPGRTDNEIKNYWRTRVQKQAKQLNCDVNSKQFQDAMRYVWIPRLMERIQASTSESASPPQPQPQPQRHLHHLLLLGRISTGSTRISCPRHRQLRQYDPTSGQFSTSGSGFYEYSSEIKGGFEQMESCNDWSTPGGDLVENLWNEENIWFLQQQLNSDV
ncbi:hypothetical protein M0R45_005961 [Rubus argutus]|uniref:Uncharacterized protein n=1 Tax=Rubus argutus TaxID=59490 RepID=A0AAW1YPQ3_RUBAR